MEKDIDRIKATVNTMKMEAENHKPLEKQVGGLVTRCDKIEGRVTHLEGARTEVID